MDPRRFDALARTLATAGATRRGLIKAAGGGLAGGLAAVAGLRGAAAYKGGKGRPPDPCVALAGPSFRTCGHDEEGNPICVDVLSPDNCGGCGIVCGADQDCCLGTCRTRLTVENCDQCSACPPGDGWVCNPTLHDTDGDGVGDAPGCDCVDPTEATCSQF
jgi:hypothetical protein